MKLKSRSHQFFEGVLVHILFHHFVFITLQSSVAVGLFSETMVSIFSNKAIVSLHTSYNCLRVLLFSAKHFLTFKSVIALLHFHLAHESQLSLNKEKILSQKFYFTEIYFLFVRGMNRETPSLKLYNGSIPMDHSIPKSWQDKMHRLVWQATHTQSLNSTIQR